MLYSDLRRAVDLQVIKARDKVASESTITRDTFRDQLVKRDVLCVWTGMPAQLGVGLHIIPYKRGDKVCSIILREDVPDCLPSAISVDSFDHISSSREPRQRHRITR
jgi:hypothetical protein